MGPVAQEVGRLQPAWHRKSTCVFHVPRQDESLLHDQPRWFWQVEVCPAKIRFFSTATRRVIEAEPCFWKVPVQRMELNPKQSAATVRVAVLVEGTEVPAWVACCIRSVLATDCVNVCLVILNPIPTSKGRFLTRLWRNRRFISYKLFGLLDRWLFKCSPDAFATESTDSMLSGIPRIRVNPRQTQFADRFGDQCVAEISAHQPNVILSFCHRILRGKILDVAAQGVWSFHHGDGRQYRGGPPGFWEVMERNAVTGSMLQVLSERLDGGKVLSRSWSATDPTSVARTVNQMFWKTTQMIPRALIRLALTGSSSPSEQSGPASMIYSRRLYRPPGNLEALSVVVPHVIRAVSRRCLNKLRREQWQLLYSVGPELPREMRSMKRLRPPTDRLWADPMVIETNGKVYIFVEEMPFATGIGHIAMMEFDPDSQQFSTPQIALQRPYHLSYPHVFQVQDQFFMIPESSANRQIELYVADRFPFDWRLCSVLLKDVNAVDATIMFRNNKWWMFVGIAQVDGASPWDEVFLFHSPTLLDSSWTAHPANPIVSDVRRARPAGPILSVGDSLYRPSQDCSRQYGYGLRLNRIDVLNELEYRESESAFVTPEWESGLYGVHHVSHGGGLTMMDVSTRTWRLPRFTGR